MDERLATAQEAAIGFVRRMRKEDAIEVIDFDSQVRDRRRRSPTTSPALERAIRQTTVNGSTSLYNAIYIVAEGAEERAGAVGRGDPAAGDRRAVGRRRHVEPGRVRRGARPGEAIRDGDLRDRPAADRDRARRSSRKRSSCCGSSRRRRAAGCSSRPSVAELPKIYEQISEELASQYSIAYSSKNPMRNGAWRRVVVRVKRPGLAARTRRGYYGPAASER